MYHSRATSFSSDAVGKPLTGQWPSRAIFHLSLDLKMWLYVLLALCMVSVLAFVHLGQTSDVAKQIEQMEQLEVQLLELKQGNNGLRLQIAEFEQMPRLMQQAQALGLGKPERIEYVEVSVPQPVAMTGGVVSRSVDRALTPMASPSPTWWIQAVQQFGSWVQVGSEPNAMGSGHASQ